MNNQFNRLYINYMAIKSNNLVIKKDLSHANIKLFENLLNDSQPKSNFESNKKDFLRFLYKTDPSNFIKFLLSNNSLKHFILWTDTKQISQHFELEGIVYIKWNGYKYIVSPYRKQYRTRVQRKNSSNIYKNIDPISSYDNYPKPTKNYNMYEPRSEKNDVKNEKNEELQNEKDEESQNEKDDEKPQNEKSLSTPLLYPPLKNKSQEKKSWVSLI